MAMVFRSTKDSENPKKNYENDKVSLNTDFIEKYNRYSDNKSRNRLPEEIHFNGKKIGFGSLTEKNSYFNINSCNNFSPGPGTYNLNNNMIKKCYNKFINSDKKITDILDDDNSSVCFLSNQKRFKTDNFESTPGPGHYFSEKKNKKDENKKLITKYRVTYGKTFSPNRVISIPYSYDERNIDEHVELDHDHNKSKEKDKISLSKNINKDDINHKILSNNKNKEKGLSNNSSQYDSNNFFNSKTSTFPTISNSLSIINYNNNINSSLDKYFHLEKSMKEVKLSNTNTYKYNYSYNNIHEKNKPKIIISRNTGPGPGQYSISNIYDKKSKDIKFQNFGSTSVRDIFSSLNLKNYKNFFKEKNLDNINDNNNENNIITINNKKPKILKSKSFTDKNKYKNLSKLKIFYKSKEDILKEKNIYEKKLSLNSLGPGAYEPENVNNKHMKKLNYENFGSLEKRFPISSSGGNTPGPGKYLSLKYWGSETKIKTNSFIPQNILKENAKKIKALKENIFIKKIISEKNKSPSVGLYSPEKINSIDYNNQKLKDKNSIFNFFGFGSTIDRVKLLNNKKEDKVDQIYNLDYPEVKFGQQIAPFSSSTEKKEGEYFIIKDNNAKTGPGSYRADSYFDWNKKSYNILFN